MQKLEFFIPLRRIPTTTAQEQRTGVRNGKPYRYDTAELKAVKLLFRDHLARHAPPERMTGPVDLSVCWCFPASDKHPDLTWKTTKPDTDNMIKLLKDEMTKAGFWKDDAQVCSELSTKIYSRVSGVAIAVQQLSKRIHDA